MAKAQTILHYRINYINLNNDTGEDAVLLSNEYWYFGKNAYSVPDTFRHLIAYGRPNPIERDTTIIDQFIEHIKQEFPMGVNGLPFDWKSNSGFERFKGDR